MSIGGGDHVLSDGEPSTLYKGMFALGLKIRETLYHVPDPQTPHLTDSLNLHKLISGVWRCGKVIRFNQKSNYA